MEHEGDMTQAYLLYKQRDYNGCLAKLNEYSVFLITAL